MKSVSQEESAMQSGQAVPASVSQSPQTTSLITSNVKLVDVAPQPASTIQRYLGDAAKYTVLAVFILYVIGFVVWHSYLADFGVSSVAFLQTEYLSAAFCYL